ncbi:hypothetical protein PHLCEN_2v6141 [Hermanssonia centrifuga]|uniref:Uncharacterized protein n=1 Tax=Hermanssonia centrifuga TaxID=98765 RepID=A0A2R6P089_9APHY|nr:hypothetical protein PHLCEN_2v6141 [Hermanssonia centrifuga]
MTITIRVQYKGEAARKLAADGQARGENDPPLYAQDVSRALSLFSIPPPDNTRAIWKSGFVLCNYNITRDNVRSHIL